MEDGARFASLKKGQSIFSITLAEALDLFKTALPYSLGEHEGNEIVVGSGKYGPYIHYKKAFISLPRSKDPLSVTKAEAIELIAQHQSAEAPIADWGDVQVMRGRYGAYIHTAKGNYQIPKNTNAEELTEAQTRDIIAHSEPLKPLKRTFKRKSAK